MPCKELKEEGKGIVKNHEEIEDKGKYIQFKSFLMKYFIFQTILYHYLAETCQNLVDDAGFRL